MPQKIWVVVVLSEGLGRATIKFLLSRQQRVIALIPKLPGPEQTFFSNPNLDLIVADLSSETAIREVANRIASRYECVDVFISLDVQRVKQHTSESVSVYAERMVCLVRCLLPLLRRSEGGHIINRSPGLASVPSVDAVKLLSADYAAGCRLEALYAEVRAHGIKVTVVGPETRCMLRVLN